MNWKLFWLAFCMLFIAELGDKTQLTVFTLATQHKDPLPVFLGASLALVVVTLLGSFLGGVITRYIPTYYLRLLAGLLFVGIGIFILREALPQVWHVIIMRK
ncbi:putative Ca2+/H+ antiporter (TMEM165/GDT1 family) [Caldicoprobacter guelmensis]|uniref:TMEM165/GDT1 family protein n=1 Tax=Caldicoprobacter guelmensis TaxID=1170224 RepID=UPI00195EF3F9|nr:TMEM165/GDT1 family protein [Caldicoprobacter guelmensis]MBM7582337.1 putative Ca2+/H+ antiporter (TMEM165/GDT1 family) [Caldicoprobacter guelmensis]